MQKLGPDQVAELVAACHAGDSTYVLARRYAGKRETVSKHLEQAGAARRGGDARRDPSIRDPAAIREWARQNGYQVSDRLAIGGASPLPDDVAAIGCSGAADCTGCGI